MPDLTSAQKEALMKKHEQTLKLRAEFLKKLHSPYAHGHGGTVFEPAVARFQAMRVSNYEHFKPTLKSFRVGFLTVVFPICLFAYLFKNERDGREQKYRTGQVAYKDRQFKFI